MDISDIEVYLTDKNNYKSLMNRIDFVNFVTEDDYNLFQLTDKYQFRVDMIADDLLGNKNLYFFIIWLNGSDSLVDTVYNHVLGQGDGCSRHFHFELLDYPLEVESSTLFYQCENQTHYSYDTNIDYNYGNYNDDRIVESQVDYTYGLIDIFFAESCIPDLDSDIWIKYTEKAIDRQAGGTINLSGFI